MNTVGQILKNIREEIGLPLQEVQEGVGINLTLLSKIENGKRMPTNKQIEDLATFYNYDVEELNLHRESDQIINSFKKNDLILKTLKVAEQKAIYGDQYMTLFQDTIYKKPIQLESRRYIGSKAKLTDWIMDLIDNETENINTFVDLFAGTAAVSKQAIQKYKKVIINDILYSNNVIYHAFFQKGEWDEQKINDLINNYNSLNANDIEENYFSVNFGGKFYENNIAKKIGFIRQDIENMRFELNSKEYNILLATLIYNIDRIANTVGHFDAYIKKPIKHQALHLRLIDVKEFDNVDIYRENSNILARQINSDLVYIDPPYNSRQYSRFYHLYETLIKWDKPMLHGVALKPIPENMSVYCTVRARDSFEDLVKTINTRYLVVSYNNTYKSKSHSSENKIKLVEIEEILNKCGETKVFERSHSFFNTGKTEFADHKELLFITKVDNERKNKSFPSLLCW